MKKVKEKKEKFIDFEAFLEVYEKFVNVPTWTKDKYNKLEDLTQFLSKFESASKVAKSSSNYNLCGMVYSFTIMKIPADQLGKFYHFRNQLVLIICLPYSRYEKINRLYHLKVEIDSTVTASLKKRFGHWFILNNNSD